MRSLIHRQAIPFIGTVGVCLLLYLVACLVYPGFFSLQVFINFLSDNSFLGIVAIGSTFVILSGGIDLSVGAMVAFFSIFIATLVERGHWSPVIVLPLALAMGTLFGLAMGCLIHFFTLPPFLVTLAGLFLCRGLGLLISTESISLNHPIYQNLSSMAIPLGTGAMLPLTAIILLLVYFFAIVISLKTPFGRNVYALGGAEGSARLMGLPVARTKLTIYALNGGCSALAGIVYTLYTSSGNAIAVTGMELDAIAAVVVGGTLLSGGVGYVAGTMAGIMIFGIIQTMITFQGSLSSWWTKIFIGGLLLVFILIQRLIHKKGEN